MSPMLVFALLIAEASHLRADRRQLFTADSIAMGFKPLIAQDVARGCGRGWSEGRASVPLLQVDSEFACELQADFHDGRSSSKSWSFRSFGQR